MTKILFVGEGTVSDAVRCKLPAVELSKYGYEVAYLELRYREQSSLPEPGFDCVIFSRPHHSDLVMAYRRLGVPTVADMDDHFESIPETHPGYKHVGKGDPIYLMKLENCLSIVDRLVVTTEELKRRYSELNQNITVVPNGWSSDNFFWLAKRNIYRDKLLIGWGGTITHREDFLVAIPAVKTILKKYENTMVVIAGDPEIYRLFANVPQKQKLFIPMVEYDIYPALLSHCDIWLAPLLVNEFNEAKSDIKLVDAGAKSIPYVASDISIYKDWPGGGFLVYEKDWLNALEKLVTDPELRMQLGREGRRAAQERDMLILVERWKQVIETTIHEKSITNKAPQ